jgi:hypothetical protein
VALGLAACAVETERDDGGDGRDGRDGRDSLGEAQPRSRWEPPVDTLCGDGLCSGQETVFNCPEDCTPSGFCGDGVCSGGETPASCPADCIATPVCGDGVCSPGENCPVDCAPVVCGDCICSAGEVTSCPSDCGVPGYPTGCLEP